MKFDVPTLIHSKPIFQQWKEIFPGEGMRAKIAYKTALRVYWRTILSESQNHRCCWCGVRMTEHQGLSHSETIEHILPKSKGGKNHTNNYAVACHKCNSSRGTQTIDEFLCKIRLHQGQANHSKDIFVNKSKEFIAVALIKKGIKFHPNSKPARLRRKFDLYEAAEAVKNGGPNPFEMDSRSWKNFERYSISESFSNNLILTII